jgi:apolipoprotein N-acyltransferase
MSAGTAIKIRVALLPFAEMSPLESLVRGVLAPTPEIAADDNRDDFRAGSEPQPPLLPGRK